MWEHPGHLFFLPVKHISFVQTAKAVALKMEQPWLQRLWPDNNEQMSTLQPQADVLPMFEQPVSFRNSLFWYALLDFQTPALTLSSRKSTAVKGEEDTWPAW